MNKDLDTYKYLQFSKTPTVASEASVSGYRVPILTLREGLKLSHDSLTFRYLYKLGGVKMSLSLQQFQTFVKVYPEYIQRVPSWDEVSFLTEVLKELLGAAVDHSNTYRSIATRVQRLR